MRMPTSADGTAELPLAIEPYTGHLVVNASHPSAIQFFSPQTSTNIAELEIAPRNYIARRDERQLTHTCVERIVFSPESNQGTSDQLQPTWMATFDTWQDYTYTPETHLKLWIGYPASASASARPYTLNTRIDKPHGNQMLTSMSFPSSSPGSSLPLQLATTSSDGVVKLWTHRVLDAKYQPEGAWICQYSFNFRSLPALDSAFSHDASLLAVLHPGSISLWSTKTATLVRSITIATEVSEVSKICFAGLLGDIIAVSGNRTLTFWDLLSCEGE
jgi:NET1-associated nuclear protein 1 (U3 small nucleolar RNA-associated protein 17)